MRRTTNLRNWKSALTATVVAAATTATPIVAGAAPGDYTNPDTLETSEDAAPLFIDVLDNDDPFAVITGFTPAPNGTVAEVVAEVDGDPVTIGFTYQPAPNTNGPDAFTYSIEVDIDGEIVADTADVTIDVAAEPDAPVANDDAAPAVDADPILEDGPAVDLTALILDNDTDADGDELEIVAVDSSITEGTVTFDSETGAVTYQATDQSATEDSFGYTIRDNSEDLLEASGTVTITIVPNDDAPVGVADTAAVDEEAFVSIPVLENDTDDGLGDKSIASVGEPTIGTAEIDGANVVYTAPDEIAIETDATFTYQLNPTDGVDGDTVLVTVTVTPVDDAPTAVADEAEVDEADSVEIDVLTNDDNDDGGPIEITDVTDPDTGSAVIEDDIIVYTHEGDSLDDVTFEYEINDDSTATVTVSVINSDDDIPVVADVELDILEDADATVVPVLAAGQTDVDGTLLEIADSTDPALGTVDLNDGVLTYTPADDANGDDSFVVTVTDGTNDVAVNVDVTIDPVNDAPIAEADSFTDTTMHYYYYSGEQIFVLEDESTVLPLLDNDNDIDNESLSVVMDSIDIDPAIGSATPTENGIRFTPTDDWSGFFSFTYTVTDGELESEPADVSVYVIPLSDAPVALPDFAEVDEDDVVYVDVLDNDYDVDNGQFSPPSPGLRLEIDGPSGAGLEIVEISQPENGYAVIAGDRIRVESDPDFNGELVIEYRVRSESEPFWDPYFIGSTTHQCSSPFGPYDGFFGPFNSRVAASVLDEDDDSSYCATAIGTLVVEVDKVNDAPVAVNDVAETDEDLAITIDVLDNDSDIDADELSIWRVGDADNGSTAVENDQIVYTPDADFHGDDAFVYFVTDGELVRLATVEIEISSINDDPAIEDETLETDEDESATFEVAIADVEDDQDDLSVSLEDGPSVGEVDIDGTTVVYTPPANFHGEVSFELLVEDTDGGSAVGVVVINVVSLNDLPTVSDVTGQIDEDESFEFTLDADDVEDGTNLSVAVGDEPADGEVEINGLDITYTPSANWNGDGSFTLVVTDSDAGEATATISVDVAAVNDRPTASDTAVSVREDGSVTFQLDASDVDGDELTLSLVDPPALLGDVSFDGTEITWEPSLNFTRQIVWQVRVSDGNGLSTTVEVTGWVSSVNDAPVIQPASVEVDEDGSVEIEIDASDVDGDRLTLAVIDGPAKGETTVDGLSVTYTPNADANGADAFEVEVTDAADITARATISIDIAAIQDAPTAVPCGPLTVEVNDTIAIAAADCGADVDGDALTIAATSASAGSARVDGDSVIFTAPADPGVVSVDFTISDGNGGEVEASVSVNVEPSPSPYAGATGIEGEVVRLYSAMLGRQPDAGGFAFWVSQRKAGMSFEQMVNHFAASPEFVSTYGDRINDDSNQAWVDFIYAEIMDRVADAGGRAFWLEMLENGTYSRAGMVVVFSQSPEYRRISGTN